jgi:hypothetical protein
VATEQIQQLLTAGGPAGTKILSQLVCSECSIWVPARDGAGAGGPARPGPPPALRGGTGRLPDQGEADRSQILGIKNGSDTRTLRSLTHPAAAQLGIHDITGEGYRCRARTVSRNLYGGAMGRRIKVGCANRRSLSYYTAPNAFAQAVKSEHPSLRQVVHRCGNRFY